MEEGYIFQGEKYSSYYQLEKVMKIPRKTIQYRHETIGMPLDDVPSFQPKPPLERLGVKTYFPKKENKNNDDELKRIIEYSKAPDFLSCSEDHEEEVEEEYKSWLMDAPVTLLKRELRITNERKQELLDYEEKMGSYLLGYPRDLHEKEKEKVDKALEVIQKIKMEREIED